MRNIIKYFGCLVALLSVTALAAPPFTPPFIYTLNAATNSTLPSKVTSPFVVKLVPAGVGTRFSTIFKSPSSTSAYRVVCLSQSQPGLGVINACTFMLTSTQPATISIKQIAYSPNNPKGVVSYITTTLIPPDAG